MLSRPIIAFTGVLCVGGLLSPYVPLRPAVFWGGLVVVAILAAGASRRAPAGSGAWGGRFLCDRCKYNDARYCSRPERPNATHCPDYKSRVE